MFSKSCEYGMRAVVYIAGESLNNRKTDVKGIADKINSPVAFTGKILQFLVKKKFISSQKGPNGGFSMNLDTLPKIKIADIVVAFEGEEVFTGCGFGLGECLNGNPCPLHNKFCLIVNEMETLLRSTSIEDMTTKLNSKKYVLKR